jgi:hypothetical protein
LGHLANEDKEGLLCYSALSVALLASSIPCCNRLNWGFRRITGEIMAYLNSDDLLIPGALHHVAEYFHRHPEVDIDHDPVWVLPPHDNDVLSWADYVPQETLFWRRRIWDKIGGAFDESFDFALDWDLLLRFRDVGARLVRWLLSSASRTKDFFAIGASGPSRNEPPARTLPPWSRENGKPYRE